MDIYNRTGDGDNDKSAVFLLGEVARLLESSELSFLPGQHHHFRENPARKSPPYKGKSGTESSLGANQRLSWKVVAL